MKILRPASENEVVECFVRAELGSSRYGDRVAELAEKHGGDARAVLAEHRSWGRDEGIFHGLPDDVRW